jgi:para-aminobenzoate synthetase/4-amino-4-deoxychorismate lyase
MDPIEALVQVDDGARWLHLTRPVRTIAGWRAHEVAGVLREVESAAAASGCHAVGFVAYEAGAAFDLSTCPPDGSLPLAWFALFEPDHVRQVDRPVSGRYDVAGVRPSLGWPAFESGIARIKEAIGGGHTYQVNLTFDLCGRFDGDPLALFADLAETQGGRYSAFIRLGSRSLCSASPELFFARDGDRIAARPMKGTARRGRSLAEDEEQARRLAGSAKERAENVMIVDMMRNDLGRVAEIGSVEVPELFAVERYPTLWQMTSLVTARTSASLPDLFGALHPPASVTGAPKTSTMRIISDLERRPRGVYTGAIGHVRPGGAAQFSVAIRTAVVDEDAGTVRFGVGSGIVWDSDAAREYEECLLKGAILGRRPGRFDLLETMRWTPAAGFFLLDRHLDRLRRSATYFGYRCNAPEVVSALDRAVAGAGRALRVRLLLARDGQIAVDPAPFDPPTAPARIALARYPIDPADPFFFHKTTHRAQYDRLRLPDHDDVILWTPDGLVTETTLANIVVDIGGRKLTPPVECGLLAGTFREELLARGEIHAAPITLDQVRQAGQMWLINSVRGWWPATLATS